MTKETKIRRIESQMKTIWLMPFTQKLADKYKDLLAEWKKLTEYPERESNPITAESYQGFVR